MPLSGIFYSIPLHNISCFMIFIAWKRFSTSHHAELKQVEEVIKVEYVNSRIPRKNGYHYFWPGLLA